MIFLQYLFLTLACFRLAEMASSEEGPAGIFALLRRKMPAKTNVGRGIRCFNCWSVWIAGLLCLFSVWLGWLTWPVLPVLVLAVSGGAMVVNRAVK